MQFVLIFLFIFVVPTFSHACGSDNKIVDQTTVFIDGLDRASQIRQSKEQVQQLISDLVRSNLTAINVVDKAKRAPLMAAVKGFWRAVLFAQGRNVELRLEECHQRLFYWTEVIRTLLFYSAAFNGRSKDGKELPRPNPFILMVLDGNSAHDEVTSFGSGEHAILEIINKSHHIARPYMETVLWVLILQNGFVNFKRVSTDLEELKRELYRLMGRAPIELDSESRVEVSSRMRNYRSVVSAAVIAGPQEATLEETGSMLRLADELAESHKAASEIASKTEISEPRRRLMHAREFSVALEEKIVMGLPAHFPRALSRIISNYDEYPVFATLTTFADVKAHIHALSALLAAVHHPRRAH
jgi:hypothetical protein